MLFKSDVPIASWTVHLNGGGASNLPLKLTLGAQGEEGRRKRRQLGSTASVALRLTGLGIPRRPRHPKHHPDCDLPTAGTFGRQGGVRGWVEDGEGEGKLTDKPGAEEAL